VITTDCVVADHLNDLLRRVVARQRYRIYPAVGIVDFFFDNHRGCIVESTLVRTMTGNTAIECIRPGTILRSGARVVHAYKLSTSGRIAAVRLGDSAALTPTHPMKLDETWIWPKQVNAITSIACSAVYNLLLDEGHNEIELVSSGFESVIAVSVGHELTGEIVAHDVYGCRSTVLKWASENAFDGKHCLLDT
jgi:hypothetical protein